MRAACMPSMCKHTMYSKNQSNSFSQSSIVIDVHETTPWHPWTQSMDISTPHQLLLNSLKGNYSKLGPWIHISSKNENVGNRICNIFLLHNFFWKLETRELKHLKGCLIHWSKKVCYELMWTFSDVTNKTHNKRCSSLSLPNIVLVSMLLSC